MAKRTRPSGSTNQGTSRKPVTIDLKAEAESKKPTQADPSSAEPPKPATDKPAGSMATDPNTKSAATTDKSSGAKARTSNPEQPWGRDGKPADKSSSDKPVAQKTADKTNDKKADKPTQKDGYARSAATTSATPGKPAGATAAAQPKQGESDRKGTTPPPQTSSPPTKRRGGIGVIAGGVLGGLVALLGAAGLQWGGVLPSLAPSGETVDITPLESQIAELQNQVNALSGSAPSIPTDLSSQLQTAIQTADQAQSDASQAQTTLSTVTTQIENLQSAISSGGAGDGAALQTLSDRLQAIETQVGSGASDALSGLSDSIGEINDDIATLRSRMDTVVGEFTPVQDTLTRVQASLDQEVAAINARLAAAESQLAEGGSDAESVARAVAAAGLKSAVDRGSAFMPELEAYASVAGNDDAVTALRNYAASGVPTASSLADDFSPVANRIVAAGQGIDENASITDRLMSSARGLVQVRPVGEVEGDTPGAIAARIETDLKAGDLAAALTEWDALPDAAKEASSDFMNTVQARLTVDQLVASALQTAMSAAGTAGATQPDATPQSTTQSDNAETGAAPADAAQSDPSQSGAAQPETTQ